MRDAALAGRRPAVSIVTISAALGSDGDVVGRALAEELSYTFADREIILKAAERLRHHGCPFSFARQPTRSCDVWR